MPNISCYHCGKHFYSKHSTAKYCSRRCSGIGTAATRKAPLKIYTDKELLDILKNKSKELGKTPPKRSMKNPDERTYRSRFGSWNMAILAAGLIPNLSWPKSFLDKDRPLVSLSMRFKILNRDKFICQYCGGTPKLGYVLHVDHIKPVSKGGKTEEKNLITACLLCNSGKSDKNLYNSNFGSRPNIIVHK